MDQYGSGTPRGYPDPAVYSLHASFNRYVIPAASIERLWTGGRWTEGPVWFGDHNCLLFSDIPNDRILCWSGNTPQVSVFRAPASHANGNTRDRQGRLITCEQGSRRLTRTEHDGRVTVLLGEFEGKPLNGPNDVIVDNGDQIWFTDPGYGILSNYEGNRGFAELPTRVYRFDPHQGRAHIATEALARPNGLCLSPDQSILYVVDTGCTDDPQYHRNIMKFNVLDGGCVGKPAAFCDLSPGRSDGIRCDVDGNIWSASGFGGPETNGVRVFAPDGTLIGRIDLPEPVSNLCFGGPKKNRLFITGSTSLYSLFVEAQGL